MDNYVRNFARELKQLTDKDKVCSCCAMVDNNGYCTFKGTEKDKIKICEEIKNKPKDNRNNFYE